ncbi:hypothetical protein IV498_13770 [Paenarthrobacter sp. Z7-10]|uniref:hypothetical protein n=1 Tax=Paenarthrobacter sp. Z7-10 TaxID=2787635 RepID=UPI0022A8DEFB|nr:hypothetical protein [Paenarthrobacter sp. Z7-10]MCZ2404218.1 hypothetical protein [Paenarthrobacter sp. Z7-10]
MSLSAQNTMPRTSGETVNRSFPESARADWVDIPPLRRQALQIIGSVLRADSAADHDVKTRLRGHIATHSANPQRALLEHLLETMRINNAQSAP